MVYYDSSFDKNGVCISRHAVFMLDVEGEEDRYKVIDDNHPFEPIYPRTPITQRRGLDFRQVIYIRKPGETLSKLIKFSNIRMNLNILLQAPLGRALTSRWQLLPRRTAERPQGCAKPEPWRAAASSNKPQLLHGMIKTDKISDKFSGLVFRLPIFKF